MKNIEDWYWNISSQPNVYITVNSLVSDHEFETLTLNHPEYLSVHGFEMLLRSIMERDNEPKIAVFKTSEYLTAREWHELKKNPIIMYVLKFTHDDNIKQVKPYYVLAYSPDIKDKIMELKLSV